MNPDFTTSQFCHDRRTRIYHWICAILILIVWVAGLNIDSFPRGVLRTDARSTHFLIGLVLLGLLLVRLAWRLSPEASRAPAESNRLHRRIVDASQAFLYIWLGTVILLGIVNAFFRGDSIFGLFSLPSPLAPKSSLRDVMELLHLWAAHALIAGSVLHGLAALLHWERGRPVLLRMWRGAKGRVADESATSA